MSYSGQHVHPQLDGRREAESDDRHAVRVGAGARARRQDEFLGTRRAALSRTTTSRRPAATASARTGRFGYADISPYYDKVDTLLGISGTKENLPQLPDGIFQRPSSSIAAR